MCLSLHSWQRSWRSRGFSLRPPAIQTHHFWKNRACQRPTRGSASWFTSRARLQTSQCKCHVCLNLGELIRRRRTKWNCSWHWMSLQAFLSHGLQKSIPSSTDTYLVPSANNYVIRHSVKKVHTCELWKSYWTAQNGYLLHAKSLVSFNGTLRFQL